MQFSIFIKIVLSNCINFSKSRIVQEEEEEEEVKILNTDKLKSFIFL